MSWATQRARLLGKAPAMSLDDVFARLRSLDAGLFVQDGHLEYLGPEDADLAAGIEQHRAELTDLFTYAPGGRCVFSACYRLLGQGDVSACSDHRREIDALVMPWEDKES